MISTIQFNTIQYDTVQCNAIQHNTIRYSTITFLLLKNKCLSAFEKVTVRAALIILRTINRWEVEAGGVEKKCLFAFEKLTALP